MDFNEGAQQIARALGVLYGIDAVAIVPTWSEGGPKQPLGLWFCMGQLKLSVSMKSALELTRLAAKLQDNSINCIS